MPEMVKSSETKLFANANCIVYVPVPGEVVRDGDT
jgi:hypothetical protein